MPHALAALALLAGPPHDGVHALTGHDCVAPVAGIDGPALTAITPPALWYSGETHEHIQLCGTPPAPDLTPQEVYDNMLLEQLNVVFAHVWGVRLRSFDQFLDEYASLVTGEEHPITFGDPEHFLLFSLELSSFPGDQFGHALCVNIDNAAFPAEALFAGPVLDFCNAQEGALTGYAHVLWANSYDIQDLPLGQPLATLGLLAPADAALGKIDFIETAQAVSAHGLGWTGLYYKLLRAGRIVAPTAGRDANCLKSDVVTYARVEEDPLTLDGWIEGIRGGRTTLADGPHLFLDLSVEGVGIGATRPFAAPGTATVAARLFAGPDVPDEQSAGLIEIVQDGATVATAPYDLTGGGSTLATFELPVDESGWFAAFAHGEDLLEGGAHTAAVFVEVAGRPICNQADGAYFDEYLEGLATVLIAGGFETGNELPVLLEYIAEARKVYQAVEACDSPLPNGVTRFGVSAPSCNGRVHLDVLGPPKVANPSFGLTVLNAPPNATGLVVVGLAENAGGSVGDLPLLLDAKQLVAAIPIDSHSGGYAEVLDEVPVGAVGMTVYVQTLWDSSECAGPLGDTVASSDGLCITFAL